MRTTMTLDPDVAELVKQYMRRTGKGLKAVVNDAIRRGLGSSGGRAAEKHFKVEAHAFGIRPGIDLDRLNQVVDELEAAEEKSRLLR
jgi:hypothetical protein